MRTSHKARAGSHTMELQLGPLIDCVFLLLTYFIFTISLTTIEGLLPSELALGNDAEQQPLDPEDRKEVIVRVVQTGAQVQFFIDDWPVTDFSRVSKHLAGIEKTALVVIDAGPNVEYEHVIRLYNDCLRLKIENVVFPLTSSGQGGGKGTRGSGVTPSSPSGGSLDFDGPGFQGGGGTKAERS